MYAGGGVFGAAVGGALGGGGSSRELDGLPPPRDGEGSLDEVDVSLRARSGIGAPSGEMYWICDGDVKWVGAHRDRKTHTVASGFCSARPRLYPLVSCSALAAASRSS